jgi:hypothetical protein
MRGGGYLHVPRRHSNTALHPHLVGAMDAVRGAVLFISPKLGTTVSILKNLLMMWPFVSYPECSPEDVSQKTYDYVVVGGKG